MAKNLTRKGLAFGAGIALVASGFAGAPANAVGIDNSFVSLAPSTGTEYDQLQALTLDLTGSFTNSAASGASLKYLVTDTDSVFKADVDVNASSAADTVSGITNLTAGSGTFTAMAFAADLKTITFTGTHDFNVGDQVTFAAFVATATDGTTPVAADSAKINATHFITEIGTTATFKIVLPVALTATTVTIADASGTATFIKTSETGNATRAEIAAAPLGSRSVLGVTATVSARAADGSFVVNTADTAASGVDNVLRLVSTAAADTSATATVTAWIDNNDDGLIDTTEYVSPTRTVRFLKTADVAFTTTWDTLVLGGSTYVAHVTIAGVNISQIASSVIDVDFLADGASTDAGVTATYSSTAAALVATASQAIVAGVYSAQADYGTVNYGSAVYKTVGAAATDVSGVATPAAANSANVNAGAVKTGTTAMAISSQVKYWSTYGNGSQVESDVAAGVPAVVTITKTTLASGSTVTAGGKTLASTGTSISFDTTTNALGKVAFDLAATGTKGTVVTVVVKVEDENTATDDGVVGTGTTGGFFTSSALTLTWGDATVATTDLSTALGFGGEMGIAKGSTNTLSYDIRDNFGASSAVAGTYRVSLALSSITGGASWSGAAAVSGGKASYTFTDNTITATGVYTVTATLEKLNTGGTAYDSVNTTTTIVRVGSSAATAITTTTKATAGLAIDVKDFVTADLRLDANSVSYPYTATGFQVTGLVKSSTGAPIAGAAVTVSAAGVAFAAPQSGNFTTYTDANLTVGSATVYTNASGAYSVTAWSHTAGTNTFTVTTGAVSATTSQTWAFAVVVDKDTTITISAPASTPAASVAKGSVTLNDKWGNVIKAAVPITFVQSGPGYVVATPTVVSATTGSVDFVLLTGSNDTGTTVITVTHNSGTSAVTTDDVTVSANILVGAAAVVSDTKVNVGSFKGFVALYAKGYAGKKMSAIVAGKWIVVASLASDFERVVRYTGAGYDIVTTIYIDGVMIETFNTTTK
jgi:hypothetical protein